MGEHEIAKAMLADLAPPEAPTAAPSTPPPPDPEPPHVEPGPNVLG